MQQSIREGQHRLAEILISLCSIRYGMKHANLSMLNTERLREGMEHSMTATSPSHERKGIIHLLIARGYRPIDVPSPRLECVVQCEAAPRWMDPEAIAGVPGDFQDGIGFVLPTAVGRGAAADQLHVIDRVYGAVARIEAPRPIVLFVGIQWQDGEKQEARTRLERIVSPARSSRGPRIIGISIEAKGKVVTLNAAFHLAGRLGFTGIGWVDDDIHLDPDCLSSLVRRFIEKGGRGALGATKIPLRLNDAASNILYHLKRATNPAGSYPHGCCMLVDMAVVKNGIPIRYASDDGFVCFELLRPHDPNPLGLLEIVPEARCRYHVGGRGLEVIRRLHRILVHHHIFLADYPREVSRYYFREILFTGLWPFAARQRDSSPGAAILNWTLKAIYLMWFTRIGLELAVRGLINHPLRREDWGTNAAARSESTGETPL